MAKNNKDVGLYIYARLISNTHLVAPSHGASSSILPSKKRLRGVDLYKLCYMQQQLQSTDSHFCENSNIVVLFIHF